MDLKEFNTLVLGSVGIIDETGSGHLSRVISEDNIHPFMIGKKRVVLPTAEHLRESNDGTLVYHPLSENITRGQSDMIKALRDTIMFKLTYNSVALLTELGRVAATDSEHKRLDASSSEYLKAMREMDEKTYDFLKKVVMKIGAEPEHRLVSISLRKAEEGEGVRRVVKFTFPVLETMLENDKDLLGVKYPSKKARANLIALFEVVLGNAEERLAFNFGSKNLTAPYFHALMTGFYNMASRLNMVVKKHKKLLGTDLADELITDLSWHEALDELSELRKKVPPQEGNEGEIIVSTAKERERVADKLAERIAPVTRSQAETRKPVREEKIDLPWEDSSDAPVTVARGDTKRREGKSIDDYLGNGRSRDDRGRDRDDRDDRGSRRFGGGRDRDDRDDRDRGSRFGGGGRDSGPRFDLGLGNDRDDRDRGRSSERDFRRDDRGNNRRDSRPFGSGHSRTAF
jgi:hypothetical protein